MDGYAVGHGLDDLRYLRIDRFVNFVWWLFTRNGEEKDRDKFKARLWMPPKGQAVTDRRSPWSPANETSAFAALQSTLGLKSPKPTDATAVRSPGRPAT